jgi:hypothetical protein
MTNPIELYSIIYDQNQKYDFIPIFNSTIRTIQDKSYLFEYNPILKKAKYFNDEFYYGIFSWKFKQKTGIEDPIQLLKDNNYQDFEVINFCKPLPKPYLELTEEIHTGFIDIFEPLCERLGLKVIEPTNHIYSNFFVAKGIVYKEYVEVIKQAIELLETEFKELAWRYCRYEGLTAKDLKRYTGLDYYTFHTFVIERLISVWIENKNIKTLNLIK